MDRSTILLVEDDAFYAQILVSRFEAASFAISHVRQGEDVIKAAQTVRPDLILLEIVLSKKNGFEILDELKSNEETRDIPVAMLTRLSSSEDVSRCLLAGACTYFIKTHHTPDEVVAQVAARLAGFSAC